MSVQSGLSVLAGVLVVIGFIPYILAIWRDRKLPIGTPDKAEPSKATWIIWGSLDVITLFAMYAKDALNGQIVGAVAGSLVVVLLALKYGKPGWTNVDKVCISGALLSIVLWQAFNSPVLGIVTSLIAMLIGAIPTFMATWRDPSRENKLAWTLFFMSCVAAVGAIPAWTLEDTAQPFTFLVIQSIMIVLLFIKPRLRFSIALNSSA